MRYGKFIALAAALTLAAPAAQAQIEPGPATDAFRLDPWVTGVTQPTDVAFLADGRAVIVLRRGDVIVRRKNGTLKRDAAFPLVNATPEEGGLLGVAAYRSWRDPADGSAAQNTIFLFATVGNSRSNRVRILKGIVQGDDTVLIDASNPIVTGIEGTSGHYGGGLIVRGEDLYFSVGDMGFHTQPPSNRYGSCLDRANGKILRVRVNGAIPGDNPLVGLASVTGCDNPFGDFALFPPDTRIYAWGLRNPFRFWVDPMTGLLWVGDVGENTREEVSVGGKGSHFGFPFFEGNVEWMQPFSGNACAGLSPSTPCVPPAFDWVNRRAFEGGANPGDAAAIGGLIPDEDGRLCGWPGAYASRYFFGDHGSGRIRSLGLTADRSSAIDGDVSLVAEVPTVAGFRMGFDDGLYVISEARNAIVRLSPRNREALGCPTVDVPTVADPVVPDAGADAGEPDASTTDDATATLPIDGAGDIPISPADAPLSDGGPAPGAADSGCGCRTTRARNGASPLIALGLAAAWLVRRSRRSRLLK